MARQVQWLNANKYRKYPFVEDSDLTAGSVIVPDSAILDLRGVNYVLAATPLRLTSFQIVNPGGGSPVEGTFTFTFDGAVAPFDTFNVSVPENAAFPFASTIHDSAVQHVTCVFGDGIADLLQETPGTYTLNNTPQIEPAVVSFQDRHRVTSITASGAGQDTLTGAVQIEEGYNCQVVIDTARDRVTISANKGAGAGISCDQIDPAVVLCAETLLRINGLRAADLGDFMLAPGDGVEIVPDAANHQLIVRGTPIKDELECG